MASAMGSRLGRGATAVERGGRAEHKPLKGTVRYPGCDIRLVTGPGRWENSGPTYRMSEILRNRGIAHHLDDWGPGGRTRMAVLASPDVGIRGRALLRQRSLGYFENLDLLGDAAKRALLRRRSSPFDCNSFKLRWRELLVSPQRWSATSRVLEREMQCLRSVRSNLCRSLQRNSQTRSLVNADLKKQFVFQVLQLFSHSQRSRHRSVWRRERRHHGVADVLPRRRFPPPRFHSRSESERAPDRRQPDLQLVRKVPLTP